MTVITFETFRDGAWKEGSRSPEVEVSVAGGWITVTLKPIEPQPPWRVLHDGAVIFERSA